MTIARRFTRSAFLWALAALLTEGAVSGDLWRPAPPLLTMLPLVPLLGFVFSMVRAIWKMDELQKRICLESVFIAFMLTLIAAFTLSALARAGIYRTGMNLGTPMMLFFACAYVFSVWRYR
jgi:hypothetical protein